VQFSFRKGSGLVDEPGRWLVESGSQAGAPACNNIWAEKQSITLLASPEW
jgi:hypothetical protein